MPTNTYPPAPGGHPEPTEDLTGTAKFTESYAFIPGGVMKDIVTSNLPGFRAHKAWIIARPMTGFSETFVHMIVTLHQGGGSRSPEPDPMGQAVIFVTEGRLRLTFGEQHHHLEAGGYAYLPAGCAWEIFNIKSDPCTFHWIRKAYQAEDGIDAPAPFVTSDSDVTPIEMPKADGKWSTTRFVDPDDMSHDMHVNIVNFEPGGRIPFEETHVMEHGLFVLEGTGRYNLNQDWYEVEAKM